MEMHPHTEGLETFLVGFNPLTLLSPIVSLAVGTGSI